MKDRTKRQEKEEKDMGKKTPAKLQTAFAQADSLGETYSALVLEEV